MQTFGLIIAFVLVALAAILAVAAATALWLGLSAMRPELLGRGPREDDAG